MPHGGSSRNACYPAPRQPRYGRLRYGRPRRASRAAPAALWRLRYGGNGRVTPADWRPRWGTGARPRCGVSRGCPGRVFAYCAASLTRGRDICRIPVAITTRWCGKAADRGPAGKQRRAADGRTRRGHAWGEPYASRSTTVAGKRAAAPESSAGAPIAVIRNSPPGRCSLPDAGWRARRRSTPTFGMSQGKPPGRR
jgi:hypothetical protein